MLKRTQARVAPFSPNNRISATLQRLGRRAWSFAGPPHTPAGQVQCVLPVYVFLSNPAPGQPERVLRALRDLLSEVGLELESPTDD